MIFVEIEGTSYKNIAFFDLLVVCCTCRRSWSLGGRLPLQNVEAIKPSATGFYSGFYDDDDDDDAMTLPFFLLQLTFCLDDCNYALALSRLPDTVTDDL